MATGPFALEFSASHSLFKRCVQCPNIAPQCPSCKSDEDCVTSLGDCLNCVSASCVKKGVSGATISSNPSKNNDGPNIGAIVGGTIAGVIVIALVVFCFWKFYLKGRRHEVEEEWEDPDYPLEKPNGSVFTGDQRGARSSTHTVYSMASTVLTRASNIIQIAYIPGVTNRTNSSSPGLLVPPVPPIPIPTTPSSMTNSNYQDQHFFVPGDLRDSTYSDMSDINGRRPGSIASSLARNSVATTVYRDSAVINPMPATTIISGKPTVVSVKSGLSQTSSPAFPPETPPVPSLASLRHGSSLRPMMIKTLGEGPSPNNSARSMKPIALNITKKTSSSALSGASTAVGSNESTPEKKVGSSIDAVTQAAIAQSVGLGLRPMTQISIAESHETATTDSPGRRARQSRVRGSHQTQDYEGSSDEEEDVHDRSRRSLLGTEPATRQNLVRSPFSDDAEVSKTPTSPIASEPMAQKMAQRGRTKSPFDDPQ
ncbi:opy2 protein [Venturia nashicola]|uniref:Opy2 protein n=1 Tax=Venturia nashicola TaxID=86259 RepID=A0A4Z1PE11_9PEZI|nr:opy2 protein [Venturia nashicola]TLD38924.1 opy2 protein [Venturia nashicola]